jgi:MOSC domain-containing protein YiiM
MATIVSIAYTRPGENPRPEDHYARTPFLGATLIADKGIVGDRKGKGGKRQLNLMSAATLGELATEGFKTGPGEMGEQIAIEGLDVNRLSAGARLRLGSEAVVEVNEPRTGCDRFERIQGKFKGLVSGRLGVMARVVQGGSIAVGDEVTLVSNL